MQYIGRIFSSAKRIYRDLNSATLNGAIDVVVVRYEDGELVSSPFYVQFGKTGILRPCADEVEVSINGVPRPDIRMRVNRLGQAYFDDPDDDFSGSYSPKADSGINLQYQFGQSPPTADTSCSPPLVHLATDAAAAVSSPTSTDSSTSSSPEEALLHSVPNLLQSADFGEFESYMQWWNQDPGRTQNCGSQIHTYRLTDEQSEAVAPQEAHANLWVFWDEKWYSWKTANIKLRFLRNLGTALPQVLQLKLMEVDRQNPAFILLPERPCSLDRGGRGGLAGVEEREQEDEVYGTQFTLDHTDASSDIITTTVPKMKPNMHLLEIFSDTEASSLKPRGACYAEFATSLPGTPHEGSPVPLTELAYFSDGYSPLKDSDDDHFNEQLTRQWTKAQNTRAFRLSSDVLKQLDLVDGVNEAVFTTINKYQGACTCYCLIYVWNSTDKIVISDVDGTITKSDFLGHVLHWVGVEWIHLGVVELFKKISDNGFRLMYLSARSIGQASLTRSFLEGIEQGGEKLPPGPIILSPNSLITTIQMEIIQKRPQVLKIANLKPLIELFRAQNPQAPFPFYAGFGNRASDVDSYRAIGIPDSHIFIVNPEGLLETASGLRLPTGYSSLSEMVDTIFPPEHQELEESTEYSDFSFWRFEFPSQQPRPSKEKTKASKNRTISGATNKC